MHYNTCKSHAHLYFPQYTRMTCNKKRKSFNFLFWRRERLQVFLTFKSPLTYWVSMLYKH